VTVDAAAPSSAKLRGLLRKAMEVANSLQHRKDRGDTEAMILADTTILIARSIRRLVENPLP
jgi:hypothetical protein